jgi:hypothetical protein
MGLALEFFMFSPALKRMFPPFVFGFLRRNNGMDIFGLAM